MIYFQLFFVLLSVRGLLTANYCEMEKTQCGGVGKHIGCEYYNDVSLFIF